MLSHVVDDAVPTDRRQSLVDAFNRPSDNRRLFLLSAKAGGVGINLCVLYVCFDEIYPSTHQPVQSFKLMAILYVYMHVLYMLVCSVLHSLINSFIAACMLYS